MYIPDSAQTKTSSPSPEQLLFSDTPDAFLAWINSDSSDANALGDDGKTPLAVLAIEQRHTLGLALLIEHGADVLSNIALLKERGLEGLTLLLLVQTGHLQLFTELLKNGFDANLKLKMGPIPVPNFLLRRVDQKVIESPILHVLVESPEAAFVAALLDAGARVDDVDSEGNCALHVTATKPVVSPDGSFPMVEVLLAHKADKSLKNRQGYTPVEYMSVFFNAISPQALEHPAMHKLREMLTPEGRASSIILLS